MIPGSIRPDSQNLEDPVKRVSLVAAAALLLAGAQLHAQATKQDSTKKPAKTAAAPAKQSGVAAKVDGKGQTKGVKTAAQPAHDTGKAAAKDAKTAKKTAAKADSGKKKTK